MADFELTDQVVIVTGAAGGIGRAISHELAQAGAMLALAGRTEATLEALAAELGDSPTRVVPTDITDPESVQHLVDSTVAAFGRLDVIINNAGGGSAMRNPEDTPYDEWVRLIDFNLTGTFNCCIAAGKQMIEQ